MTNIMRKKKKFLKKTINPLSKISFINDNVFKSIMIIKNLWINTRTKLAIIFIGFFMVASSFAITQM